MPNAEIITIGTEILLGEILDTNARFIAQALRQVGINLFRKTTVGDNAGRIAQAIREALERCDILITTGGLGPTIDDPTREAVALAFNVESEFHPELWEQIQARFQRFNRQPTENNRRQAFLPANAIAVENPVGTAPAFIVEISAKTLIALPGVPREMEFLLNQKVLPYLKERYQLKGTIKSRTIHTSGVGESMIDDRITDLELLENPTVGLAAHSGQVDVRITARADSDIQAEDLIRPVEAEIRHRLGKWVYGADQETLESIAIDALQKRGWSVVVVEAGLGGELTRRLIAVGGDFRGGEVLASLPPVDELRFMGVHYLEERRADVCLVVGVYPAGEKLDVHIILITPEKEDVFHRPYGGPPDYGPRWALHHSLDILRNL